MAVKSFACSDLTCYNKLVLHSSHSTCCILEAGLLLLYKQAREMVSHQQAQLRDNWTQKQPDSFKQLLITCYSQQNPKQLQWPGFQMVALLLVYLYCSV